MRRRMLGVSAPLDTWPLASWVPQSQTMFWSVLVWRTQCPQMALGWRRVSRMGHVTLPWVPPLVPWVPPLMAWHSCQPYDQLEQGKGQGTRWPLQHRARTRAVKWRAPLLQQSRTCLVKHRPRHPIRWLRATAQTPSTLQVRSTLQVDLTSHCTCNPLWTLFSQNIRRIESNTTGRSFHPCCAPAYLLGQAVQPIQVVDRQLRATSYELRAPRHEGGRAPAPPL